MLVWIWQFLTGLPSGFPFIFFVAGGFSVAMWIDVLIRPQGRCAKAVKADKSEKFSWMMGVMLMAMIFGFFGLSGSLLTFLDHLILDNGRSDIFSGYSRGVGFEMMLVGAVAFALLQIPENGYRLAKPKVLSAIAWCRQQYAVWRDRREHDPQRIMQRCQEQFAQAKIVRRQQVIQNDTIEKGEIEAMNAFDQAGENILAFLDKLLRLMAQIDQLLASSASLDTVATGRVARLIGVAHIDRNALTALRKRAQEISDSVYTLFVELPVIVGADNVYREAASIEGFQESLATLLPKTTKSKGILAELETGQLQTRLITELRGEATPTSIPDRVRV